MKDIIGDQHKELRKAANLAYDFRNKIIHGQQTGQNLDKEQLASSQSDMRTLCTILAVEGNARFGYDGFARDSLRKTHLVDLTASVDQAIQEAGWEHFMKTL